MYPLHRLREAYTAAVSARWTQHSGTCDDKDDCQCHVAHYTVFCVVITVYNCMLLHSPGKDGSRARTGPPLALRHLLAEDLDTLLDGLERLLPGCTSGSAEGQLGDEVPGGRDVPLGLDLLVDERVVVLDVI